MSALQAGQGTSGLGVKDHGPQFRKQGVESDSGFHLALVLVAGAVLQCRRRRGRLLFIMVLRFGH